MLRGLQSPPSVGSPAGQSGKRAAPRTPSSLHRWTKGCPMSNQGPHIHLPPTTPFACWQRAVGAVGPCPHPPCIPQQVVAEKWGSVSTHLGMFVRMQHKPFGTLEPLRARAEGQHTLAKKAHVSAARWHPALPSRRGVDDGSGLGAGASHCCAGAAHERCAGNDLPASPGSSQPGNKKYLCSFTRDFKKTRKSSFSAVVQ